MEYSVRDATSSDFETIVEVVMSEPREAEGIEQGKTLTRDWRMKL